MSRHPVYIKLINASKWVKLRNRKLKNDPMCERCKSHNRIQLAEEVHHIVPVESVITEREMNVLMYNYTNLMSVCKACHAEIHKEMMSKSKVSVKAANGRRTQGFINKFFLLIHTIYLFTWPHLHGIYR